MISTKRRRLVGIVQRAAQQGFRKALDGGERSAKFVRDVGHEILPHAFQAPLLADVVQHQNRAAGPSARTGAAVTAKLRGRTVPTTISLEICSWPASALLMIASRSDCRTTSISERPSTVTASKPRICEKALVGKEHALLRADNRHALDHAAQDCGGAVALFGEHADGFFQSRRGLIQCAGQSVEFSAAPGHFQLVKIALRDATGKIL